MRWLVPGFGESRQHEGARHRSRASSYYSRILAYAGTTAHPRREPGRGSASIESQLRRWFSPKRGVAGCHGARPQYLKPEACLRKEECQRGDHVDAAEHRAFEPVGLTVEGDEACHYHGGPEGAELQGGEVQVQRVAEQGPEEDEDGGYQEGDLQGGAQRDAHREVHVVFVGDLDADDVFGDVADYRYEDDPDKELGDPVLLSQGFYGPDEHLRDVGDGRRCHEQQHERSRPAERGVSSAASTAPGA